MKTLGPLGLALTLSLTLGSLLACGGGGGDDGGEQVVVEEETPQPAIVPLTVVGVSTDSRIDVARNEVVTMEFSTEVDPESVTPATIQILHGPDFDLLGPAVGEFQVDGKFVHFRPALPTLMDLSDAGLGVGTRYRILFRSSPPAVSCIRALHGGPLTDRYESEFWTWDSPDAFSPAFFLDENGPEVLSVIPANGSDDVDLTTSRIEFDLSRCPLHPGTVIPENFYLLMVERDGMRFHRLVPCEPEVLQSHDSVRLVVRFGAPLERRATYDFFVQPGVRDLAGYSLGPWTESFQVQDGPTRFGNLRFEFNESERTERADLAETTADWGLSLEDALSAVGSAGDISKGQTKWHAIPALDLAMIAPRPLEDAIGELFNDSMFIYVQMARDTDVDEPGTPDLTALDTMDADGDGETDDTVNTSTLSEWTPWSDIEELNGFGYQQIRVRIIFVLDPNHNASDPFPFLDQLSLNFQF